MAREIRFRMWDKKLKKMWSDDDITVDRMNYFDESFDGDFSIVQLNQLIKCSQKDNILMQFTGLLDKNGKEIYEGDKLLWHNQTDDPDSDIPPVTWQDSSFLCGNDILSDLDLDAMEIIGNIYENPELLGGE